MTGRWQFVACVAVVVACFAGDARAQSCSEQRVLEAIRTLQECGLADGLELGLPADRTGCVEQMLRVAVPTDSKAVADACRPGVRGDCWKALIDAFPGIGYGTLVAACQPGTTGGCMEVLLQRGRPQNDEGWREMGRACAFVSGPCARLFVGRFRVDWNDLKPFHEFCATVSAGGRR